MRTSVEIQDTLWRRAGRVAAERRTPLEDLVTEALRAFFGVPTGLNDEPRRPRPLPLVRTSGSVALTPVQLGAAISD